jgi:voltage-dependent calcium channel alpha-2/delta-3
MCNQAIMLITDEIPYLYEDLFQEYNWRDLPRMPVRLFSYLIGREVPDVERIKWVACANQGGQIQLQRMDSIFKALLIFVVLLSLLLETI